MLFSFIVVLVLFLMSLYVNYILYRKVVFFENWFENLAEIVERIYENMTILDERGVMNQDDSFGHFFDAMKEMMIELFSMGFYNTEEIERLQQEDGSNNMSQGQVNQQQKSQQKSQVQAQFENLENQT